MEENERVKADKTLFKVNGGQIQNERRNEQTDGGTNDRSAWLSLLKDGNNLWFL